MDWVKGDGGLDLGLDNLIELDLFSLLRREKIEDRWVMLWHERRRYTGECHPIRGRGWAKLTNQDPYNRGRRLSPHQVGSDRGSDLSVASDSSNHNHLTYQRVFNVNQK